ncbi:protein kinase [Micromonospora sp. NPDC050686]|uniref:serine/threonine-protein kinase n=1 Tax=Micromonospora sp. NPDC050686 TaxID=3154631 RepID=UPI003400DDCF
MLTRGVVLSDRYLLGERIATGGMGAVWRCTDTLLGREVAVKVLLPSLVADPEFTTRFHAEARMLAALRHPGIVAVHDFGSAALADGSRVSYLVMEYVDGEPLTTWVRRAGRLDPASTMSVVAQAARALHTAHLAGIVHRDVKPGNLLVKRDGSVVLVDFGIARASTMAGITAAHMVLGTASYMSPEQANGQPVSPATDVYALGVVAWYCLAGRPPFEGDNPLAVAIRHAQDEPPPLPSGTPPAVVEVLRQALMKRPADRYPSGAALADAAQDARDATLAVLPAPPRPPWAVPGPVVADAGTPFAGHPVPPAPAGRPDQPANPGPQGTGPSGPPAPDRAPEPGGPPGAPDQLGPFGAPAAIGHPAPPGQVGQVPPGGYPSLGGGAATLEEPRPRRRLALAGVAGIVVVALATLGTVAALSLDRDEPDGRRTALTGDTVSTGPESAGPGPTRSGPGPKPSATGRATASPASPAARTTPPAAPTGTAGATSRPGTAPTRSTTPTTTAPATTPGTGSASPSATIAPKPNPYTARQVCGDGYQVIDSAALVAGGTRRGTVYLLYDTGSGANCVVTMKATDVGSATAATAYLEVAGGSRRSDSGSFEYYAGPVRATAAGKCVKWGGSAGGAGYGSPFEHCG